jgi:PKD repeat protein
MASYLWDFGDGETSSEQTPRHVYRAAGVYSWSLTYTDDYGGVATTSGTVTITADTTKSRESACLRLAVEPTQGLGWAEYEGDDWLTPELFGGILSVRGSDDIERNFVEDQNGSIYEEGTFDRVVNLDYPWVDKEGDSDSEIASEKWFREETAPAGGEQEIEQLASNFQTRPERPENKGKSGYDSNGYRTAQQFDLDLYVDGDLTRAFASCENIPENGEVNFGGHKFTGHRFMYVFKTAASAVKLTARKHLMRAYPVTTRAERTTNAQAAQVAFSDKEFALDRGVSLGVAGKLKDLVSKTILLSSVTAVTGPDGRGRSAFQLSENLSLGNSALSGDYTIIFWRKTTGSVATIDELGAPTAHDATFDDWQLVYLTGSDLAANLTLTAGTVAGLWIINSDVTSYLSFLYSDIRYNAGKVYYPLW